jgi:hypothetical protein
MKKPFSGVAKLTSLALVFLFTAPSAATAWENTQIEPDEVLSITFGAQGEGDGDGELCDGVSSIELSSTSISATLDELRVGTDNPSLDDRLAYFSVNLDSSSEFISSASTEVRIFTPSSGNYLINQEWASGDHMYSWLAPLLDTNNDGAIDSRDATPATVTYRVYATNMFSVSYDADDCLGSFREGEVEVQRTDFEMWEENNSAWDTYEFEFTPEATIQDLVEVASSAAGNSMLTRNTQIGGQTFTVTFVEEAGVFNEIMEGQQGTTYLRSITRVFGDDLDAQFRQRYGFWLYTFYDD